MSSSPKESKNMRDTWGMISALTSIVLIVVLIYQTGALNTQTASQVSQTKILQSQFVEKDRPWIGIESFYPFDNNTVKFNYFNYGAVPSIGGKYFIGTKQVPISRNDLEMLVASDSAKPLGVSLPNQRIMQTFIENSSKVMNDAKAGGPLYLGILMEYNYGNNSTGEYGMIMKYSATLKDFYMIYNWVQ